MNTLQGISSLHRLPNYFTAPKFQHRAVKRQEGSVPAYIPINTWQVWRFQIPSRCSSMNPPTCIPIKISKNIQSIRLESEHSHKHWVKMKAFALFGQNDVSKASHCSTWNWIQDTTITRTSRSVFCIHRCTKILTGIRNRKPFLFLKKGDKIRLIRSVKETHHPYINICICHLPQLSDTLTTALCH